MPMLTLAHVTKSIGSAAASRFLGSGGAPGRAIPRAAGQATATATMAAMFGADTYSYRGA